MCHHKSRFSTRCPQSAVLGVAVTFGERAGHPGSPPVLRRVLLSCVGLMFIAPSVTHASPLTSTLFALGWHVVAAAPVVRVPNVVGLDVRSAWDALEEAGLRSQAHQPNDLIPGGNYRVVHQDPAAGITVARGTLVNFSLGLATAPSRPRGWLDPWKPDNAGVRSSRHR